MKSALLSLAVAGSLLGFAAHADDHGKHKMLTDGIDPDMSAAQITKLCDGLLSKAKMSFEALENSSGPATLDNVVGAFDAIIEDMLPIRHVWHIRAVHPEESIRDAATACSEKQSDFFTQTGLSKGYYDRIAAIDLSKLNKTERFMVESALSDFRRAGVDKDEATRNKIRALQQEITEIGNEFNKNIRSDVRYVDATIEQLDGLPQDYIDARPADENGIIKISTDYPDLSPVMTYSTSDDLRHKLRIAARSRGYPQNEAVLKKLIEKRHELANILGFKNHAEQSMDDKMIASPENAQAFLTRVGEALKGPVEKELDVLLERLQEINPDAKEVQVWQSSFLQNLIRQEDYALDSKEVREYFHYEKVRAGIFQLTEDLFGVDIQPWETATWHEDVETYQIMENGKLLGRFYMDNHPRADKYKHAAHWTLRPGIKGKQIPLSGLAQNFPRGLMEHGQVETFLHEFGHLIHNMFSGTQKWYAITGMSMERDFVEAPSQMLEEWIWDYDTLKTFASNEKGETIPKELVAKMNRARDFGLATGTATQIFYANLSLNYYNREPDSFELDPLMLDMQDKFAAYPYVEGTHFYANFGHLNGYSSNYYTYQWSLAIATDLFSRFEKEGMRNKKVAADYRNMVLGAAGSKPAADFVADFLGREFNPEAYIKKLQSL
ncbi:M3 family metallopeptidase [Planctobacterium marinum]|uniref:Zn-dependent oligopeptidase n=1 Tax=Planctobacterium marinum TaxID=1631968 RepID=A0AA48HUZ3_9ALTE|nr:Zn-dependent oligopeptidase [Planctobacterium marinum]